LAYHGLAEPFVFVFFGVIAVNASYFVLTGRITEISIISSIMPGLLSTNLLLVNNLRDVDTDEPIGKYTLAVKIGKENSRHLYLILNFIVFFIPILLAIKLFTLWMLLPMLAVPLLAIMSIRIYFVEGKALNRVLAMNGLTILLNGILTSISFIILKIYG
jgi:1,4-dihydroxy-2-naphthoate octaprenyltransferase